MVVADPGALPAASSAHFHAARLWSEHCGPRFSASDTPPHRRQIAMLAARPHCADTAGARALGAFAAAASSPILKETYRDYFTMSPHASGGAPRTVLIAASVSSPASDRSLNPCLNLGVRPERAVESAPSQHPCGPSRWSVTQQPSQRTHRSDKDASRTSGPAGR